MQPPAPSDGLPSVQRRWAILASGTAILTTVLDGAMTNIALPTIATAFDASAAESIWVIKSYQLVVTIALLPLAALGESIGYHRVFRGGLVLFIAAALLCCVTTSLTGLTAARALQGLGAAGVMSVNAALLRAIYPAQSLGRGIGINAMIVGTASASGPSVAAAIMAVAEWRWLFAVTVPMGLLALALSPRIPQRQGSGRAFDWTSTVLNGATLGLFFFGIGALGQGERIWFAGLLLVASVLVGYVFVRSQLQRPAPVLPVDLLAMPVIGLSVIASILAFICQMLAYVALPFHLQATLGRTVVETGALMTAWPVATALMAPLAGRLADRYPAGLLGCVGLGLLALGLGLLTALPLQPSALEIAWRMALCGIGFGLFQTPNNRAILMTAPVQRSGSAGGMLGTARLIGQTTGAALVGVIFARWGMAGTLLPLKLGVGAALFGIVASGLRLRRW